MPQADALMTELRRTLRATPHPELRRTLRAAPHPRVTPHPESEAVNVAAHCLGRLIPIFLDVSPPCLDLEIGGLFSLN